LTAINRRKGREKCFGGKRNWVAVAEGPTQRLANGEMAREAPRKKEANKTSVSRRRGRKGVGRMAKKRNKLGRAIKIGRKATFAMC